MFSSDDVAQGNRLAALVSEVFPSLELRKRRLETSGGDHVLLIVDDHFAFRFPRRGMHGLGLEIAVLERLRGCSSIQTPSYQYVDPKGRFAGYPLITGSALTAARFAALPPARQGDILQAAALFLTELHSLFPEAVVPEDEWPHTWTVADYAKRAVTEYLPSVQYELPDQAAAVEAFYESYSRNVAPRLTVVHGDLVDEHVLLDDDTGQLSGIIDFGDVALGDPAQDFQGFWAYGADAARQVVALYSPAMADPGLLARSLAHFGRHQLDRVLNRWREGDLDRSGAEAEIDALLAMQKHNNS